MRVLILANNDVGLYKFRKELLERLVSEGHEVFVSLPDGEFVPYIKELGCQIIDTPVDRRGMNPLKDLKLLLTYRKLIKKLKPQVVLTYTIKPNVYGGLACRMTKTPYLANITGVGVTMETPGLMQKIVAMLYRVGLKKAKCVFFQNKGNMQTMEDNGIKCKSTVLLPGSGVNLDTNFCREYPGEDEAIRFITVLRVLKNKGIEEFLECAYRIKKNHPKTVFTIVGGYDDYSYQEAIERAHNDGIIEYLGFRRDVPELMGASHCVVNASYYEGMSNVLLEAAACGRAVIASDIPGCRETFDEGVSGFGFEAQNADALISCVERFLALSPEEREQMGKAGRAKVEREFDRNIIIEKYLEQLDNLEA